jgi:di/tricarboxylate transporter
MVFFIRHRNILVNVDWGLILVLALMFVNMRLIADNHIIHSFITELRLVEHERLYFEGIALAQIMSNVPAAILLADYSSNWKLIAYAVNVGGFGFVLGSLANLIALRLARDRKAWLIFHVYSLPFLLVTGTFVYLLLFIG